MRFLRSIIRKLRAANTNASNFPLEFGSSDGYWDF